MGFGQNFFRSAAETLPKGAALGIEVAKIKTDKAQDFEEKKRQRELKKKSSFDKAIESGTFLMGLTKNPASLSKGFQTIGNAIPDEYPEAKAAMKAFSLAVIRDPQKVAEAWKQVRDYQKFANEDDNAGAAVSLSKFELLASDLGIEAAQIIDAMGKGINDFNKTRSDAAMRSKKRDFELEQSTQQTKYFHSLRNLVSSLEQAKKYDKNTADLEKNIFRIVDLMQIQASKSGSPEFINNTTAKLRAIAPDFIADVAGEVRRTAIAKEAGKPAKERKLSQDIVNVLAGSQFNVKPEDATPKQIDAASKIVFNKKLQLEKEKFTELQLEKAKGQLSPSVIARHVDPHGNRAKAGLTLEGAILGEYVPVTEADQKEARTAKTVDAALDSIEKRMLAVFKDTTALNRYPIKVLTNGYAVFALNEQGRNIRRYEAAKEVLLATIGRAVGEQKFTDDDAKRVRKGFAKVFPVPDTKELAIELMKDLRDTVAGMLARPRTTASTGKGGSGQVEGFDLTTSEGLLGFFETPVGKKKDKKKDKN